MNTPVNSPNKEEKENVLLVLNEFTEEYKAHTKSVNGLIITIKECTGKIDRLLEKAENQQPGEVSVKDNQLKESIETGIEKIATAVKRISFPENEIQQLSVKLDKSAYLLQHPTPQKVVQHHHIPKITWIAAGLFIALALVSSGWYMTGSKLDGYIANDTKYRYLRLDTGYRKLQLYLDITDSLYNVNPRLRKTVFEIEEQYRHNFELLQKANRMNAEAENLKMEAKKLDGKASKK